MFEKVRSSYFSVHRKYGTYYLSENVAYRIQDSDMEGRTDNWSNQMEVPASLAPGTYWSLPYMTTQGGSVGWEIDNHNKSVEHAVARVYTLSRNISRQMQYPFL